MAKVTRPSLVSFLFAIFFLSMSVFLVWNEQNNLARYQQLVSEGHSASATITNKSYWSGGPDGTPEYEVEYHFPAVVNGQPITISGSQKISRADYDSLKTGQRIEVVYDDSDPENFSIKFKNAGPSYYFYLGIVFVVASSGFFLYLIYRLISSFKSQPA